MKYTLTLTMNYVGLGGNPSSSVAEIVDADYSNMKFSVDNESSRDIGQITGTIKFSDKYDEFGLFLNDKTGYYIDPANFTYTLVKNGVSLDVGTIILSGNNIEDKVLTFTLSEDVVSEYQNIYNNADVEYNIIPGVSASGNITQYRDFRTTNTKNTVELLVPLLNQSDLNAYVDTKLEEDPEWVPVLLQYASSGVGTYTVGISWEQFQAIGYYNGSDKEPPAGINWVYDSDVGGKPQFNKRPLYTIVDYGDYGLLITSTISVEQEADIDYTLVARDYNDIIIYLVGQADASILFDGNSFVKVGDIDGPVTEIYKDMRLITLSDFIPSDLGVQKNNKATVAMLSFNTIMNYYLSLGFYWYLELDTGDYYFRMSHINQKVLSNGNPALTDYFNKNRTFRTKVITVIEPEFDKIDNSSQSSDYNFRLPTYTFRAGTKSKSFAETRIITDCDYVIDGKGTSFDETSNNQWVLLATRGGGSTKPVINSLSALTDLDTNNYVLSFYYVTLNLFEMPGKIGSDATVFDDTRVTKRNQVELQQPVDSNIFDDFTIYDYILYFEQEAEIINLSENALAEILTMTIRYL